MEKSRNTIERNSVELLPFIKDQQENRRKPRCFWHVSPHSNDFLLQMEQGELYAIQTLRSMKKENFSPLLGWCVLDMPRYGQHTGVEIGFLSVFAEMAMRG